jgi:predicted TIM-barrel fold metal-dependent hydrolase
VVTTTAVTEEVAKRQQLPVIDCDVHHGPTAYPLDDALGSYVSERWRSYVQTFGIRATLETTQIPAHRAVGKGAIARLDSIPPGGGEPGSSPDFAREQLLDRYDMTAAILNSFGGLGAAFGNMPVELGFELTRAENRWAHDHWLSTDPRWRASICVAFEYPEEAAAEIRRCRDLSDRFVQVLLPSRTRMPIGNPHYWPIFEAAAEVDLPVAFHVGYCRSTRLTACGTPSFYFENHVDFALHPFSLIPSLIFEGVLERWPSLKFVMVELGWAWAIPLAWRMDGAWRVLRSEVPHVKRPPSEYLRDHFWYTTQPMLQPARDRWLVDVIEQFDRLGFGDKLLYSSDYPHWDFDAPEEALPSAVPHATRQRVLAENASALYGIPL